MEEITNPYNPGCLSLHIHGVAVLRYEAVVPERDEPL